VEFGVMFLLLFGVLALLFHGVWEPCHTLFSNDGPLGRLISDCHRLPGRFTGCWNDLNGIGFNGGAAPLSISIGLQYLLKPVWFSKVYALTALVILGLGAWCFFTQMRLTPLAARLGGLAAALNSCFFSVACWGVAAQTIAAGLSFFALAALADTTGRRRWWRVALAGFAVGMGVVDGSDVGAIFSLFVAAFVVYQAWLAGGTPGQRLVKASTRLLVIVLCASFIAAQAISSLVDTSIKGVMLQKVADTNEQPDQTKQARWDWVTQWSLPVRETASLVVPGVFGYRLDTPDGGAYWGQIGQDPSITRSLEGGNQDAPSHGLMRSTGGGIYAGVLVVLVAFWALTQSLRRQESVFNLAQRQWLRFWLVVAVISLLLAYGRFAPFYQLVYALPGVSTIRNPIKFIYLLSMALIVMFAYGLDGLCRKYLPASNGVAARPSGGKGVWAAMGKWERSWLYGCAGALGLALLAWMQYASNRPGLEDYLRSVRLAAAAGDIASFSIAQVGWFVLFLGLSTALLAGIFSGTLAGSRARWGGLALGVLLMGDLGRANLPWIVYWNYQEKYASNPIIDRLRDQPWEHRVTFLPGDVPADRPDLNMVYRCEWLQQQFPYYNIQTLDIVEMPRKPADFVAYVSGPQLAANGSASQSYIQMWRLTNTRRVVGLADDLAMWNQDIGRSNEELRVVERFNLTPKPGVTPGIAWDYLTATPDEHGAFALFDFTGALPRAQLFANWQVQTNDPAALDELFRPDFDPHQCVLVSGGLPADTAPATARTPSGAVEITRYSPRDILLKSDAPTPTVLLLNDHYDPTWKVLVDGRSEPLLRCNFIMRGVWLAAGAHTVEFRHQAPVGLLYVSLAAIGVSLLTLTVVLRSHADSVMVPPAIPVPAESALKLAAMPPTTRSKRTTIRR
jgi:hypothetical protein